MQDWQQSEYEEIIGQGAKLALMVYEDPDNFEICEKLKGWANDNKKYIADSYTLPESKI